MNNYTDNMKEDCDVIPRTWLLQSMANIHPVPPCLRPVVTIIIQVVLIDWRKQLLTSVICQPCLQMPPIEPPTSGQIVDVCH